MATWKFTYWFYGSEWFEWETDITEDEESIIKESIEKGILLDEVDALSDLLTRVYSEIAESMEDEDDCEGLTVHFQDPNEPFYNIPHVPRDVFALLREKEEKEKSLKEQNRGGAV